MTLDLTTVVERRGLVEQRIVAAGGSLDVVKILAVTKTFPAATAQLAVDAGLTDLGENYASEIVDKAPLVRGARWHFIGAMQRNKVKKIATSVALWQSVDRPELLAEIAKRSPGASVLIQVNTTHEPQKSGCRPADLDRLVDRAYELELDLRGLMTIGPTSDTDPRPAFCELRGHVDRLGLEIASMGMSGDLEAAVAEGSTMVRVGTALFGPRSVG